MNAKKQPLVLTREVVLAAVKRIEDGEQMLKVAVELGCSPNGQQLRTALRKELGSDGYGALINKKRKVPTPHTGPRIPKPLPSDAGLPVIESTERGAGWSWRYVQEHAAIPRAVDLGARGTLRVDDTGARILVLRSPDGTEYTQAFSDEPAHLLRVSPLGPEHPHTRLVRWDVSKRRALTDKARREDARVEEHSAAQKENKKAKVKAAAEPEPEPPKVEPVKRVATKKAAAPAKPATKKTASKAAPKKAASKPVARKGR